MLLIKPLIISHLKFTLPSTIIGLAFIAEYLNLCDSHFLTLIDIGERERVARGLLMLIYMGKKGFYHLFSDGFRTDVLFEDKKAFIAGMNIIALCFFRCNVSILAFCLMDNHVHFILYGTKEECLKFRDKFIHKYGIWYSNRYSAKMLESINFDIKLMDDERYILNSIAYVLRNCIAAGYGYCVSDYPWSSGGLYFRHPEILGSTTSLWKSLADLSQREQFRKLQTQIALPQEWKITSEGYIWPGSYVDIRHVEQLYRTARSFTYFMGQGKEEEINKSLGIDNSAELPETEIRDKAVAHCFQLFQTTNIRRLDIPKRLVLGKKLRKEYRCSVKQIARIIHLDPKYIKELL